MGREGHQTARVVLALTTGEPAGVGPEIALRAALEFPARGQGAQFGPRIVLIGDAALLAERAWRLGLDATLIDYRRETVAAPGTIEVIDIPLAEPCSAGQLDARNGHAVVAILDRAIAGALDGEFDAIVTAPVQKSTIADSGIDFMGHTEYLAARTGTPRVVMMLAGPTPSGTLRVALVTTHLALGAVPAAITAESVGATLDILWHDLRTRFGIAAPRILVTGLNPHAGENGHLGREEIDIIAPALAAARARGIDARGPLPADTLFQPRYLDHCDAVLAMYHDQGLPVLKYATFGHGVNITLGLPIIRTSVDHGTALDLAGSGRAEHGSMMTALQEALTMVVAARESGA